MVPTDVAPKSERAFSSKQLIKLLDEDLAPEHQAIISQMLCFDLENETETIRNYRERVSLREALEEFPMAEHNRRILIEEQEHRINLATALGTDVPTLKESS